MNRRTIVVIVFASVIGLISVACGGSASGDKTIKSTTSSGLTVTLASSTGDAKVGPNDLFLIFTDASGKPVDVGAASLKFHMPGMGSMEEMNDAATLTTTA